MRLLSGTPRQFFNFVLETGAFLDVFLFLIGLETSMLSPNISVPRQKFKNRLGAPESIAMMSFSPENQLI